MSDATWHKWVETECYEPDCGCHQIMLARPRFGKCPFRNQLRAYREKCWNCGELHGPVLTTLTTESAQPPPTHPYDQVRAAMRGVEQHFANLLNSGIRTIEAGDWVRWTTSLKEAVEGYDKAWLADGTWADDPLLMGIAAARIRQGERGKVCVYRVPSDRDRTVIDGVDVFEEQDRKAMRFFCLPVWLL
jgi:hypothetical protein